MTASRLLPFSLIGLSAVFAACGGESLILPPEGAAAHIEVLEETNNQSGRVNEALAAPVTVRVTDSQDRPVPGADVDFSFADGAAAGALTPPTARTNADGQASATVTLGSVAGSHTGTAQVQGAAAVTANFTVLALPADANGIRMFTGDNQTATVNTPLAQALVVLVTDANDNPIPNVPITWTAVNGGTVSAASNVTDANGQASVTRTLGPIAGAQSTTADAGQIAGSPVTFTHTATAGGAAGITKVSGDNQSGSPGAQLAEPLLVEVRDDQGNPISGRAVAWVVGTGGGTVSAQTTPTNAEGRATTNWTLGPAVGANSVNAVVSGVGTVTFNATATAGLPSAANSEVSASPGTITAGSGQSNITVTVRDGTNNPVAGASVTLASSGIGNTIAPASASTPANGVVTFTFSSTVAEVKTITATAGGVTINDQATITVQKVSSNITITDEGPDPSVAGQPLQIEFIVTGNNGGTPTGDVVVTMTNGPETCRATLSEGAGTCTLTPVEPGPPGGNRRRNITATYLGDAQFNGDAESEAHRVEPAPTPNQAPTASFTAPTCTVGQPCPFDDTSTDSDGNIASRTWTFPDGAPPSSGEDNPSVVFATPGTKAVTLTVTDDDGATNSVTHDVTVSAAPNTAPIATPDTYETPSTQQLIIDDPARGVLANDTDAETPASLTVRNAPFTTTTTGGGTVTVNQNGTFVYSAAGFGAGFDTFTYEAFDGQDWTAATVRITFPSVRLK